MKNLVFGILIILFASQVQAKISETELFYRCYAHMTSLRAKRSHPLLKQIRSGEISAVDACVFILSKARLGTNNRLKNIKDEEAKAVLRSFTKLHMSFYDRPALVGNSDKSSRVMNDIYDEQGSALFYTRALFRTDDILGVLKGNDDLEGVRSRGRSKEVGYSSNFHKSEFIYQKGGDTLSLPNVTFVQTGELLGFQNTRVLERPNANDFTNGSRDILNSLGGGVLGSKSYLLRSLPTSNSSNIDGADKMNRIWSNTVLKDFLCKSLPAVRLADGQPYKKNDSSSTFRKSEGCIRCHVTMDQLAAGGRGLRLRQIFPFRMSLKSPHFSHAYQKKVDKSDAAIWPEKSDEFYDRRPPKGALFFRSYTGGLIYKKFSNLNQLAKNILETDDYYACVAKKYYEHFTGINVFLADIQDPFTTVLLNKEDLFHRKQVIDLGEGLKRTKSTYNLVKEILKSKVYQSEGYTLLGRN